LTLEKVDIASSHLTVWLVTRHETVAGKKHLDGVINGVAVNSSATLIHDSRTVAHGITITLLLKVN
jgi:hypothetical protein